MYTRTRTREDGSTESQHAIDTDVDAESYNLTNLIAEANRGDRPMTRHRQEWCPACDRLSDKIYRCEHCGHDLAGTRSTVGQEDINQ